MRQITAAIVARHGRARTERLAETSWSTRTLAQFTILAGAGNLGGKATQEFLNMAKEIRLEVEAPDGKTTGPTAKVEEDMGVEGQDWHWVREQKVRLKFNDAAKLAALARGVTVRR